MWYKELRLGEPGKTETKIGQGQGAEGEGGHSIGGKLCRMIDKLIFWTFFFTQREEMPREIATLALKLTNDE